MANRKKGDYSVLSEINTEEEWMNLMERKVSVVIFAFKSVHIECKMVLFYTIWEKSE